MGSMPAAVAAIRIEVGEIQVGVGVDQVHGVKVGKVCQRAAGDALLRR